MGKARGKLSGAALAEFNAKHPRGAGGMFGKKGGAAPSGAGSPSKLERLGNIHLDKLRSIGTREEMRTHLKSLTAGQRQAVAEDLGLKGITGGTASTQEKILDRLSGSSVATPDAKRARARNLLSKQATPESSVTKSLFGEGGASDLAKWTDQSWRDIPDESTTGPRQRGTGRRDPKRIKAAYESQKDLFKEDGPLMGSHEWFRQRAEAEKAASAAKPGKARDALKGKPDMSAAMVEIDAMVANPKPDDRERMNSLLGRMTVAQLQQVADKHHGGILLGANKERKVTQLTENIVGHKLNSAAIARGIQGGDGGLGGVPANKSARAALRGGEVRADKELNALRRKRDSLWQRKGRFDQTAPYRSNKEAEVDEQIAVVERRIRELEDQLETPEMKAQRLAEEREVVQRRAALFAQTAVGAQAASTPAKSARARLTNARSADINAPENDGFKAIAQQPPVAATTREERAAKAASLAPKSETSKSKAARPKGRAAAALVNARSADINAPENAGFKLIAENDAGQRKARVLPDASDIQTVSDRKELTGTQLAQGDNLTPAGRRALNALGPAGHPRLAAIPDTEGKVREAFRMLAAPGMGADHWVAFADMRTLFGDQVTRAEFDDTVMRMRQTLDDVRTTDQSYARGNAATRRPAAVMIGNQEHDLIHIDDPTLSRPVQFGAVAMAKELQNRQAGRKGHPMMALLPDADLRAEIDRRAANDPIVARDLARMDTSTPPANTGKARAALSGKQPVNMAAVTAQLEDLRRDPQKGDREKVAAILKPLGHKDLDQLAQDNDRQIRGTLAEKRAQLEEMYVGRKLSSNAIFALKDRPSADAPPAKASARSLLAGGGMPTGNREGSSQPAEVTRREITGVYQQLADRPNELVSLVRLRAMLPHLSREELDAVLKQMDRERLIQLDPDPNQKALPPEARRDAIRLGGEDKHFISIP